MNNLLFLCISLGLLIFSVIVLNIAPAVNKVSNFDRINWDSWSYAACNSISDYYDEQKKGGASKETLDNIKKGKKRCDRKQAMIGLEYVTSNLNILFGFICAFSGFLVYQNIGNIGKDVKYIGIIGLGCGVVGFVLTLVYVIESGLVFNDIDGSGEKRIDSDGAYLEWNKGKNRYTCIYYDKDDEDAIYLRFSDYGNKYLNYKKDVYFAKDEKNFEHNQEHSYIHSEYAGCYLNSISIPIPNCQKLNDESNDNLPSSVKTQKKYYDTTQDSEPEKGTCNKIFIESFPDSNTYKIIYDRWLTTIILDCFVMLLNIGLSIFGFLLFSKSSEGSSGPVSIK